MFCNFPNHFLFPRWMFKFRFCWQQIWCQCIFREISCKISTCRIWWKVCQSHPQSRHNSPLLQIDFRREGEGARVKDRIRNKYSNLIFSLIPSFGLHRREQSWNCLYLFQNTFQWRNATSGNFFKSNLKQISEISDGNVKMTGARALHIHNRGGEPSNGICEKQFRQCSVFLCWSSLWYHQYSKQGLDNPFCSRVHLQSCTLPAAAAC